METIIKLLKSITTWVVLGVVASGVLLYFSCENMNDEKEGLGIGVGNFTLPDVGDGDDFLMVNYVFSPTQDLDYMVPVTIGPANYSGQTLKNCSIKFYTKTNLVINGEEMPLLINNENSELECMGDGSGIFYESIPAHTIRQIADAKGVMLLGYGSIKQPILKETYYVVLSADDCRPVTVTITNITVYCQADVNNVMDALEKGKGLLKQYLDENNIEYDNHRCASISCFAAMQANNEPQQIGNVVYFPCKAILSTLQLGLSL